MLPDLLKQTSTNKPIGTVSDDGAFVTRRRHMAILDRGGTAVILIRKNGSLWKEDCFAARARNDILRHRALRSGELQALVRLVGAKSDRRKDDTTKRNVFS